MLVSELPFLRNHWYPVAPVEPDEPGAPTVADGVEGVLGSDPLAFRLFGDDFVLWRTNDGYAVSEPFCPHRSAHLSGGWVHDGELVCPYHGWRFDGGGACTHIPQMDDSLPQPPRASLRTYPAVERYGVVWVCVGDEPVSPTPPVWPEAETESSWRFFVEFFEVWHTSAPRIIDNNLDHSHVAYVHRNTFGDPADARLPRLVVEPTELGGFRNRVTTEQPGVAVQNGRTLDESERLERVSEIELLAPLTTRTRLSYDGAAPDYAFFGTATPVDDRRSIYLRLTGLAGTEEEQPWETFHAFGTRVKEEDRVVLESTLADFPVDITTEVHLRSDRPTLEYRKYLMRLIDPVPVELGASI